jgi:solute carrier family 12 sodium/potassium/chloride transporter 2
MQTVGVGKLSPNMMLIGFQEKWLTSPKECQDYFKIVQTAFDQHLAVGIFRIRDGFNVSKLGTDNLAFEPDDQG